MLLMTPEGKRVQVNFNTDICLYDAPHNPPQYRHCIHFRH